MSFSVSSTVSFSKINWDNFENRPQINGDMPFCKEDAWGKANSKCCMDGYSIEHVLEETRQSQQVPERQFLKQYPCVNGAELKSLVDNIQVDTTETPSKPTQTDDEKPCDNGAIEAFLKTAKKFGFGNFADISRLESNPKMSCTTLIRMAFRYGALAFEMGRDPQKRLASKTF